METLEVTYQWESREKGDKLWRHDGKTHTSSRSAFKYLNVVAACKDCDGHRLIRFVRRHISIGYSELIHKSRVFYTLNSRPKE
jgi:hypothetical protein